jgi:hypothetical protein
MLAAVDQAAQFGGHAGHSVSPCRGLIGGESLLSKLRYFGRDANRQIPGGAMALPPVFSLLHCNMTLVCQIHGLIFVAGADSAPF